MDMLEKRQFVEEMTNAEVLARFGTSEDPAGRGFDDATQMRVLAHELMRARNRVAHYRALYASFIPEGKRYMIENIAEDQANGGVPVKLVFTDDDDHVRGLEESGDVIVWTEPELLETLKQERIIQDFFTDLLDELALRWP